MPGQDPRPPVQEGRTIVFVSHDLAWVERLCDRVFLIEHGTVGAAGPVAKVIAGYLSSVDPVDHDGMAVIPDDWPRGGTGTAKFRRVRLIEPEIGRPTGRCC